MESDTKGWTYRVVRGWLIVVCLCVVAAILLAVFLSGWWKLFAAAPVAGLLFSLLVIVLISYDANPQLADLAMEAERERRRYWLRKLWWQRVLWTVSAGLLIVSSLAFIGFVEDQWKLVAVPLSVAAYFSVVKAQKLNKAISERRRRLAL